jgi:hypothetical protein
MNGLQILSPFYKSNDQIDNDHHDQDDDPFSILWIHCFRFMIFLEMVTILNLEYAGFKFMEPRIVVGRFDPFG